MGWLLEFYTTLLYVSGIGTNSCAYFQLDAQPSKSGKMTGGKKLPLYLYYLMAVGWQKFQHVFFVVLIIKGYKHVKIFQTNDFYRCHSLMNKKKIQLAITFY